MLLKISLELPVQNPMKLYGRLHCMSVYKNTTRHQDWQTTTTKWWTSMFALKNFYKYNIKDTTMTDTRKLHGKLPFVTLYKDTKIQQTIWLNSNNKMANFLVCFKNFSSETTKPSCSTKCYFTSNYSFMLSVIDILPILTVPLCVNKEYL